MVDSDLHRLVRRANQKEYFVGSRLTYFQVSRQFDDFQLAEYLQCHANQLARLALCRAPTPTDDFASCVQQLARFVDCNPTQLAMLLRESDAVRIATQHIADAPPSYSLAARDKKMGSPDAERNEG